MRLGRVRKWFTAKPSARFHDDAEFRVQEQGGKFSSHLQRNVHVTCSPASAMVTTHRAAVQRSKFKVEQRGGIFGSHRQRGLQVACSTTSMEHPRIQERQRSVQSRGEMNMN